MIQVYEYIKNQPKTWWNPFFLYQTNIGEPPLFFFGRGAGQNFPPPHAMQEVKPQRNYLLC